MSESRSNMTAPPPTAKKIATIYIVTTGRSMAEDFRIRAVFLDRARAEAWIETQPDLDVDDIEKWQDGETDE